MVARFTIELLSLASLILVITAVSYAVNFRNKFYALSFVSILSLFSIFSFSVYSYITMDAKHIEDEKVKFASQQVMIISGASLLIVSLVSFFAWYFNLKGTYTLTGELDEIEKQVNVQRNIDNLHKDIATKKQMLASGYQAKKNLGKKSGSRSNSTNDSSSSGIEMMAPSNASRVSSSSSSSNNLNSRIRF